MPIYEFQCDCGHKEERIVPRETVVRHCDKDMERLISRPGFLAFKGAGCYTTEWGPQAHNLSNKDKWIRGHRDVKARGLSSPPMRRRI